MTEQTPAPSPFRPFVWPLAAALLLLYAAVCLRIADTTSPTFDEPDYLAVGYHALVTGQRPYTNINLTFTQMWSALPLLLAGTPPDIEMLPDWPAAKAVTEKNAAARAEWEKATAPAAKDKNTPAPPEFKPEPLPKLTPTWFAQLVRSLSPVTLFPRAPHFPTAAEQQASGINYGRLFYFDPRNDTEKLVFWSRAMVTLLAVALGAVVFMLTRRLWGDVAGLVALAFYCLNPQTIALGSFATTDISSTLFFILSVLAVWRLLHRVSVVNILLTGLAAGVLAATKISSLMLLPVAGLLLVLRVIQLRRTDGKPTATNAGSGAATSALPAWLPMLGGLAAAVLVAYVTLWAVYGFRFSATDQTVPESVWSAENALVPSHFARPVIKFFRDHHWFPEAYLYDLNLFTTTGSIRRAYILGDYSVDGWWYFFPVAWLFKTPLPLLAALGAGAVLLWRKRREQAAALWTLAPLLVFGAVYGAATLAGNLNIGARHLLPLHPLMFILGGAVVLLPLAGWRRWATVGALLAWSLLETALVHPHHLAYFNELAGGSLHGHRLLVDSSYEWGEDLPQVREWLAEREKKLKDKPPVPVYFSYFGCADLEHYGLKNISNPEGGGNMIQLPSFYDQRPIRPYDLGAGTYLISATMLKSLYGGRTMGPWRPSYEQAYQELSAEMARLRPALAKDAERDEFLEKEGRAMIRQQAQIQLDSADALPRDQVIQLMQNALVQSGQWSKVILEHPNAAERATLLERDGRVQLKQQAQQQIASSSASSRDLTADNAIGIATEIYQRQNKLDELTARYTDPLTNKVDEAKLAAFKEAEGRRLFSQQFIQQASSLWLQKIRQYDDFRFSRLCAYLRQREPEGRIGYGIFAYELTADEIARAIDPAIRPAEMRPSYFVKGTENRKDNEIDFLR